MSESSWESLRSDFTQLRRECAINPPIVTAGRLTAIWTVQVESEPAHWRLNYWNAKDGSGITDRFRSRAKYAAARRGFKGSGDDAVNFWLDELKAYAPEPYVQRRASSNGPGLPDSLYSVEILDVCGLSADYCWECEADEILSRPGRAEAGSNLVNLFREDASARPLGNNPFPEGYPVYAAFEEATWKAKTRIAPFKLEFLDTNFSTAAEFIPSLLTFRKRWFSATAFEATLIVGNEETAQWYEHWIDDHAKWLLEDTLSQAKRKDPNADPATPPFFSSADFKRIESELKLELTRMVEHYKGVAATRVVEVIGLRNAAQPAAAAESESAPGGGVSSVHAPDHLPALPLKFQNTFEAAKANAELEQAKLAASSPHPALSELSRLKLIQDVFFAYCAQARAACRAGSITVAQTRQTTEAALPAVSDLYFVREQGNRSDDRKLAFRALFARGISNDPQWHQHLSELAELGEKAAEESIETSDSPRVRPSSFKLTNWQDLEIRFLSDNRIDLNAGASSETRNYAEFGFEDGRSKKPNLAWVTLRALARKKGIIQHAANGHGWSSIEKRIQEIRRILRKHFELDADPIPFVDGIGYRASFKINCAPSFES